MAIKEVPINFRHYYKLLQSDSKKSRKEAIEIKHKLEIECDKCHKEILDNISHYDIVYNINLLDYEEFVDNCYYNGKFYRIAKGLMLNKENNYELLGDLNELLNLANLQKSLYEIKKDINFYDKLLELSMKEYNDILRAYYTEVHKQMILNGYGYSLGKIGYLCINRCVIKKGKPMIDFKATKLREKELKEKGIRIYNKEEAEWCKKNGIEYKAADKRVFKKDEYCYEIPLIGSKLENGSKLKFAVGDYRHSSIRGKSNDDLIKLCNGNTTEICNLPIDLKTKLTLCDKADKILYTKFIRNETQEAIAYNSVNRKNR